MLFVDLSISNIEIFLLQVKTRQEQQLKVGSRLNFFSVIHNLIFKVRNFLPPQSDEPEIFILEQEGEYNGNYGAKNGKPRKFKNFMTFY